MIRSTACLLMLGLAAGCGAKDPTRPKPSPPVPIYSARGSPDSTVADYAVVWERRDSVQIALLLADDYRGTSTDLADPAPEVLSFTKADEVRALHRMKSDLDLVAVEVSFGPRSSWTATSYPSDPPEWVVIVVPNVSILLRSATGNDVVVEPNRSSNEFKLKPTVSGTDTTWSMVRWTEAHQ